MLDRSAVKNNNNGSGLRFRAFRFLAADEPVILSRVRRKRGTQSKDPE